MVDIWWKMLRPVLPPLPPVQEHWSVLDAQNGILLLVIMRTKYKAPESHPWWPRWPWPWWSWLWWSWPWLPWSRWSWPCTIVHLQMEGMAEARSSPPTYRSSIMNTSVVSSFNTFQSWILQWSFINHEYWILQYSITFNHQYFNGLLSIMIHEYWILQYPITFNHEHLNIFYLIYSRALDTIPSLQHTGKTCNKT